MSGGLRGGKLDVVDERVRRPAPGGGEEGLSWREAPNAGLRVDAFLGAGSYWARNFSDGRLRGGAIALMTSSILFPSAEAGAFRWPSMSVFADYLAPTLMGAAVYAWTLRPSARARRPDTRDHTASLEQADAEPTAFRGACTCGWRGEARTRERRALVDAVRHTRRPPADSAATSLSSNG